MVVCWRDLEALLGVDPHHDHDACVLCEVAIQIAHGGAECENGHGHHVEACSCAR